MDIISFLCLGKLNAAGWDEQWFKTLEELQMQKKEATDKWKKAGNLIQILGESEAIKLWESDRKHLPATGARLIAMERHRQETEEGWTAEHDSQHVHGELVRAAAIYALPSGYREMYHDGEIEIPVGWPWEAKWWKPTPDDRIRELVKAGALIAADIDLKLRRKAQRNESTANGPVDAGERIFSGNQRELQSYGQVQQGDEGSGSGDSESGQQADGTGDKPLYDHRKVIN